MEYRRGVENTKCWSIFRRDTTQRVLPGPPRPINPHLSWPGATRPFPLLSPTIKAPSGVKMTNGAALWWQRGGSGVSWGGAAMMDPSHNDPANAPIHRPAIGPATNGSGLTISKAGLARIGLKDLSSWQRRFYFCEYIYIYIFFLIVCFTSYFVFSIAVLPHSPGVVYYHLLLRRETRIPRVAPFSFRIGIFLCIGDRNPIHPQPLGSCGPLQE